MSIGDEAGRGVLEPGCWVEARLIDRDWVEGRIVVLLASGLFLSSSCTAELPTTNTTHRPWKLLLPMFYSGCC